MACTHEMRVRFPGPPGGCRLTIQDAGPSPGDEGSIPAGLATLVLRREGTATLEVS